MSAHTNEAALEREGARAAARGLNWQSNPYLRREQMPAITGEPLATWVRKHDAWQRGFEGPTEAGGASRADGATRVKP